MAPTTVAAWRRTPEGLTSREYDSSSSTDWIVCPGPSTLTARAPDAFAERDVGIEMPVCVSMRKAARYGGVESGVPVVATTLSS